MSKIKPKIPIDEIHEILSIELKNYKYMIICEEKSEEENKEMYVFSNYAPEDGKQIVKELHDQLENKTAHESYIKANKKK